MLLIYFVDFVSCNLAKFVYLTDCVCVCVCNYKATLAFKQSICVKYGEHTFEHLNIVYFTSINPRMCHPDPSSSKHRLPRGSVFGRHLLQL